MFSIKCFIIFFVMFPLVFTQFIINKPGGCPPPSPVSICINQCSEDRHCSGLSKCCKTSCGGNVCTFPVTEAQQGTKIGFCPVRPNGPWVCTSRCSTDSDCRRNLKCCRNRCGALACVIPSTVFGQ